MGFRGEMFSTKVTCEGRTYFFNVKQNRLGDVFLSVVESKPGEGSNFERRSIVVFGTDMEPFMKAFRGATDFMKTTGDKVAPLPYHFSHDDEGSGITEEFRGSRDGTKGSGGDRGNRSDRPDFRREDSNRAGQDDAGGGRRYRWKDEKNASPPSDSPWKKPPFAGRDEKSDRPRGRDDGFQRKEGYQHSDRGDRGRDAPGFSGGDKGGRPAPGYSGSDRPRSAPGYSGGDRGRGASGYSGGNQGDRGARPYQDRGSSDSSFKPYGDRSDRNDRAPRTFTDRDKRNFSDAGGSKPGFDRGPRAHDTRTDSGGGAERRHRIVIKRPGFPGKPDGSGRGQSGN